MTSESAVSKTTSPSQPSGVTFIPDQPSPTDCLDFSPYVKALSDLISSSRTQTPLTLGLFGTWGSGKSTLMRLIEGELKKRYVIGKNAPLEPLWINVWQLSQQGGEPGGGWQAFLQSLFSQVHERLPLRRRLWFDLKLLGDRVDLPELFRQLLVNSYRIAIVIAPLLLAKLPQPQNLPPVTQDSLINLITSPSVKGMAVVLLGLWLLVKPLVESAREKVSLDFEKILKEAPYETQISAVRQLHLHFERLVKAWVGAEGRLVVFIDDLDRCPPDRIVEVLEALKLFATTEGCVYVLGVDHEVVARSIQAKYKETVGNRDGAPIDGVRYLEKIVQLPFLLPSIEIGDIQGYVKSFNADWPHAGCADVFTEGLPANPRLIKRAVNVFFLLWRLAENRRDKLGGTFTALRLAKIVALQTAHPEIFERARLAPQLIKDIEMHFLKSPDDQALALKNELIEAALHPVVRQLIVQKLFTLHRDDPLAMFEKLDSKELAAFFTLTRSVQAAMPEATATPPGAVEGQPKEQIITPAGIETTVVFGSPTIQSGPPGAVSSLHQLPPPPRDFTGRESELNELMARVEQSNHLIISGLGGVGKTALALTIAERVKPDFPDAQFFLDLRGVSDRPGAVADAMAHVIRAYHPAAKLPDDESELQGLYQSALNNQRALIFLDNAAGQEQVEPLIPPAGCLMIVTSRRHFTLPGAFALSPDTLSPDAAREMLLKIAPRIGDRAEEIAELCGRLPLALRLAASALAERLNLSPEDYVERLKGAKERRELIEASLSLSYEILTAEQQRLWRQLSVFPQTFDAAAAAAVWDVGSSATLDALGELVAYSLVEWDEARARYHLHNLARLFAEARLTDAERAEVGKQHAKHFKNVAATADDLYLEGGEAVKRGMERFDLEWPNIRAGHSWAIEYAKRDDEAARLSVEYPDAAAYLLALRLPPHDLLIWHEAALGMARELKLPRSESQALSNLGLDYAALGQMKRAVEYFEQALTIAREIGDHDRESAALGNLGRAYAELGETGKAIELLERQLALTREIGDRRNEANALVNLARVYYETGESAKAAELYQQGLAVAREIGDRLGELNALNNLAEFYVGQGKTAEATDLFDRQLAIAREIGARRGEAAALFNSSLALNEAGDRARAIERAEEALKIFKEIEDPNADKVRAQLEKWRLAQ